MLHCIPPWLLQYRLASYEQLVLGVLGWKLTALKATIICLPDGRCEAALSRNSRYNQVRDFKALELMHQGSVPESALSWLIDDNFTWQRLKRINNVMAILSPYQQPAHFTLVANNQGVVCILRIGRLSNQFGGWTI